MEHPIWLWTGFIVLVLFLLVLDLALLHRKHEEIKPKGALLTSLFYFLVAMGFAGGIFHFMGENSGYEFLTGYLIELTLSFDNIFVFVLIFTFFGVPAKYQHRVLFWGVLGALIMRGIFISLGAVILHEFAWVMYIFGGFLIYTGIKMLSAVDEKPDLENNKIILFMRQRFHVSEKYHGEKFFVRENKKLLMTPLFLVLILVEFSDLIFAIDSIPAIFAITKDPFIVYTSNVFAILGLRSMFFALSYVVHRFEYLKYGLSVILIIIGGKMMVNEFAGTKLIPTEAALLATITIIIVSILVSLHKTRGKEPEFRGWVPGSDSLKEKEDKKS